MQLAPTVREQLPLPLLMSLLLLLRGLHSRCAVEKTMEMHHRLRTPGQENSSRR